MTIRIEEIYIGTNHRGEADAKSIRELADSIDRHGLQNPIRVCELRADSPRSVGGVYFHLVSGRRRLEACRLLERGRIEATVSPPMSDAEIEAARAVENAHRLDLNPLEWARAVEMMVGAKLAESSSEDAEGHSGKLAEAAAVTWAADQLGRSETWVRDHLFLMRLEGKAREYTECGALPLRYAREISKLADGKAQSHIAGRCFHGGWGSAPDLTRLNTDFPQLRRWVSEAMHSLRGVPWDLAVPFNGKPACELCPSNTELADAAGLFAAGDDKAPENAACLNPRCYEAKKNACERSITAVLTKERAALKAMPSVTPTAMAKAGMIPKGVKAATIAGRARRAVEAPKAPTRSRARAQADRFELKKGPNLVAVNSWKSQQEKLRKRLEAAILTAGSSDATVLLRVYAANLLPLSDGASDDRGAYCYDEPQAVRAVQQIRQGEKEAQSSQVAAVAAMIACGTREAAEKILTAACAATLEVVKKKGRLRGRGPKTLGPDLLSAMPELSTPAVSAVLRAMGDDPEYRSIDSYLTKETAKTEGKPTAEKQASSKEAASKKPAKKKAAGKRSAKASKKAAVAGPGSCRVCGCTEGDCSQCVEATGEPCHWVEEDLCSRCAAYIEALKKPASKKAARRPGPEKDTPEKAARKKAVRARAAKFSKQAAKKKTGKKKTAGRAAP